MVNSLLLQVLIALLPVGTFQVWFSRQRQLRHSRFFIGIVSGLCMLLGHFYMIQNGPVILDLGFVAVITASLYGGFPFAVVLSAGFLALQIPGEEPAEIAGFFVFFLVYLLILYKVSRTFRLKGRVAKMRSVAVLWAVATVSFLIPAVTSIVDGSVTPDWEFFLACAAYVIAFILITHLSVYFIEIAYERVSLQSQLLDLTRQYKLESIRMRRFLDMVPLAVIFIDAKGIITHVNEIALEMGKNAAGNVVGLHYTELARLMGLDATASIIQLVLNKGERVSSEMFKIQGRTMLATACAVNESGTKGIPEGVVYIAQDVTDTQRLKDELDKMERLSLVGQMAASITHEIRNPMAVIRGFVQLLNERSPSEQRSYFRIVMEELDRANAIINDFLSLAQNRIVEKETSSLQSVLKDMLPLIWADANLRGQSVELDLCEEQDVLELNGKEIKQLILNLARNGLEAMDEKGVLRIETRDLEDRVQLYVSDTGNGIPPEKVERLFEPFYTTKEQGTGLGLALCLSIAERHEGRIEVLSTVGEGTTFIVTFCKSGYACWAVAE
ncbi:PAS domain S-box-containing protein [Cohnella sp. OV330]|uniref:ATP-binding protein n=1 Tax=Cohnella sp. OV330 TaxID=1855288 RepID=UPI0008E6A99F|nr:ATP-binding protein [Cohnella sp. OV330]SFA80429.1 PAS domain S-box-containing protein [Cohnella sp. OV330]